MKNIKILVYSIALALFFCNYHICEYFYPYNDQASIDSWWMLKNNIYAIIISLLFLASSFNSIGLTRFVLEVGIGVSLSNVIDRIYSDTTQFNRYDLLMIAITVIFAIIDYKKDELRENDKGDTE